MVLACPAGGPDGARNGFLVEAVVLELPGCLCTCRSGACTGHGHLGCDAVPARLRQAVSPRLMLSVEG